MTVRRALFAARLIDGTGGPVQDDPVLILNGDRIEEVTSADAWKRRAGSDPVEELHYPGATLTPGLIDGHVHLALSGADEADEVLAEFMDAGEVRLVAMAGENARRCLASGVTTVRDCGGPGTMITELRDAIAAGVMVGPRVLSSGMPITTTGGHCHFFGRIADSEPEVRTAVRSLIRDDVDLIKVMATGGRLTPNSAMLQPQYSPRELVALVEEATRLGRPVAAHVLSTEGIRRCVAAGVRTLEHCMWQDEDGRYAIDDATLERIRQDGTFVSLTVVGTMRTAWRAYREDPAGAPLPAALATRFAVEAEMIRRGVAYFVTSDAGVPACRFDEFPFSLAVATEWLGLTPIDAIAAATSKAARALGIDDWVGTLEAGKDADVLVVDGDPSDDVLALRDVRAVFQRGALRVVDGRVATAPSRRRYQRPAPTVRRTRRSA
ncbi:MAG: amidohydrolase family protein [Trueperaceae bacterium]